MSHPARPGRVLVIAGSDSGGGAGIQADIKSIMAQGGYATTAITALTAQNTRGVQNVFDVPPAFVVQQMHAILSDIGADVVKTGMLARRAMIEAVAAALDGVLNGALNEAPNDALSGEQGPHMVPMVVDPVMVASSGDRLLDDDAVDALHDLLINRACLVTPNLPEAGVLTRRDVDTLDDMKRAADTLMHDGARAALIKGGHGRDRVVTDLLALQTGFEVFEHERLETRNTHGTGCSLASGVAGQLANQLTNRGVASDGDKGRGPLDIKAAVEAALNYIHAAIKAAPDNIGTGHGPIGHRI